MHFLSRQRSIRRREQPRPDQAKNEDLFTIYLVVVGIALFLGFVIPVKAEELRDRHKWQAPPALVADILIREAVDGDVSDLRRLKARTHVLELVGVDGERDIERMRHDLAAVTDRF